MQIINHILILLYIFINKSDKIIFLFIYKIVKKKNCKAKNSLAFLIIEALNKQYKLDIKRSYYIFIFIYIFINI